ncbi:MAG: nucleotidyltransferase domain-containing protein [Anaerolineaceae bacterium]|nr:nucleotidyltransferase domain-containing protein [Anaerolineaceae bacterium]
MNFAQLRLYKPQLKRLARKYGIKKLYVFGSIARGESQIQSDVDFLVEMEAESSLFGVGGFGYEAQQLLGIQVDVVPKSVLPQTKDRDFVSNIEREAVPL